MHRNLQWVPAWAGGMDEHQKAYGLLLAGDNVTAAELYRQILAATPDDAVALHHLALCEYQLGNFAVASGLIDGSIARTPENAPAYHLKGLIRAAAGDDEGAAVALKASLAARPDHAPCLNDLANLYLRCGNPAAAVEVLRPALAADPQSVVAYYNLGVALQQLGEARKAADAFEQALKLMPQFPEAHCNLGLAYVDMGMYEDGISAYRRALSLRPDFPEALANLSKPLVDLRRFDEAAEVLRQAIELRPDYSVAMENYAAVLRLSGDALSALALCERILSVDPENSKARIDQINLRRTLCDWEHYWADTLTLKLKAQVAEPFIFMNAGALAAEQLVCAQSWAARHAQAPRFRHPAPHDRQKLRIGYLSTDFRRHATAYLVAELFERHDRERFEIIGYSYGYEDNSEERKRLIRSFDRFVDLEKFSHAQAAEMIFQDGVDILLDLKGYTGGTRTEIMAPRPAPIQVSYLGYPATMGADFIDYLISDATITPMDHQPFYSERLVQMPHSYQPNDTTRKISELTLTRADFGLPEKGFVFCCFNGAYKFNPTIFDIWMRLLQQTPGSVLWLLGISPQIEANLAREAEGRGVDPARLVFSPAMPISDHLARHALADLFLDTLPINAHTTASDALWAGLPVLTVLGDCFAGRVAASLLNAVGLPEMIAGSLADYEALALALAREPERLGEARARLRANLATSPLFSIDLYTRHLEAAFSQMWDIHKTGAPPQAFAVKP